MINPKQLREYVVRPALIGIGMWTQEAENLVMGTAAQESHLQYLHQLGSGPALGLWQMEPATHDDLWLTYLDVRPMMKTVVLSVSGMKDTQNKIAIHSSALLFNLRYGAIMCRLRYRRAPGAIPADVPGLAAYWKKNYNTYLGAGTVEEFIENYKLVD